VRARHIIHSFHGDAPLLDGPGDRFSGYALIGLPFQSGHVLALRRFTTSSIGPGYTSVWHRDPRGEWTFYSTLPPDVSCARYFGRQVAHNVVAPIDITWIDARRFRVAVGAAIEWHVTLSVSLATRLLNAIAAAIPERAWQNPAVLRLIGVAARVTLGTGRLNLVGLTPNGHRFIYTPRRVWLTESSHAVVDGVSVGPAARLPNQAFLGDLMLPQRGLFVVAHTRFEQPRNARSTPRGGTRSCAFQASMSALALLTDIGGGRQIAASGPDATTERGESKSGHVR
jgi:hypothetical protein